MALANINSSKVKIYNPFGLYVTPFKSETAKGDTTYFLDEVIRDTTTITQEDPTENKIEKIDWKDADLLKKFISDRGKILPRRVTGTKAIYQRELAIAIKRARHIALMPYVVD